MRLIQYANNATSRLAANINNVATSLSVTPGDGTKFPALSAGQFFMATLVKSDGTTEVVKVTARSTDTFTIVRAAEAVAGVTTAYAFSAGDKVEARLTATGLGNELDRLDAAALIGASTKNANYTVTAADISTLLRIDTSGGTRTITLPQISTLTDDFDTLVAKVTTDANTVSIVRSGTDTINGGTSYVLYSQYQAAWLVADRATNTWTAINSANTGANVIVDPFTGDGTATTFTLSGDPISENNTYVFVGGVYQNKSTYSLSGTTLTLGGAPANGVLVEVVWTQPLAIGVPADGSVTAAKIATGAVAGNLGYTPVNPAAVNNFTAAQRGAITALTDAATITPDFAVANNFSVTLGGNRILANPSNQTAGQSGVITITQDGAGSRTLAYGSNWKFVSGVAPALTTTANAVDVLAYYVESATRITARLIGDTK